MADQQQQHQQEEEEGDLYGDLADTKPAAANAASNNTAPTANSNNKNRQGSATNTSSTSQRRPKSFVDQVSALEQQVKTLQTENNQLKRNMGILYRTAKHEIQRKDAEIESLMKQLESLQ